MKTFRSILALILAFLVLVSSTSFMVGMHLCMGQVQTISLFTKADGCAMQKSLPPCHKHMKPACCADEAYFHQAQDFKATVKHIHIAPLAPVDIEQPLVLLAEVIPSSPAASIPYHNYDPPLRSCDITVANQVFLI